MTPTLAYYIHHINPIIVDLGFFKPRWYGFAYLMGFLAAFILIKKLARDGMLRMHPDKVPDLVLNCCIFGVLIGGRMGYVLFYNLPNALKAGETPMLWDFSSSPPFWGVLKVWDGGMSAHGGILFTVITLIVIAWRANRTAPSLPALAAADPLERLRHRVSLINIGDASCMVVPLGLLFGRIANFINGELYGHASSVAWAVKFPSEVWAPTNGISELPAGSLLKVQEAVANHLSAHPADLTAGQLNEFLLSHKEFREALTGQLGGLDLSNPANLETAQKALAKWLAVYPSDLAPHDIAWWWEHATNGLFTAMHNVFDVLLPARHPSQLYEGLLEGLCLFLICWTIGRLWRKDGMASGAFLTFYPIMRIIGEQFRVGDTPSRILGVEISKGVLYSIPLVLIGLIFWGYWIRRDRRVPWIPVTASSTPTTPSSAAIPPGSPGSPAESSAS